MLGMLFWALFLATSFYFNNLEGTGQTMVPVTIMTLAMTLMRTL